MINLLDDVPILFKGVIHRGRLKNLSAGITKEEILAASLVYTSNSISILQAMTFRAMQCIRFDSEGEVILYDKDNLILPLNLFVQMHNRELWIDRSEIILIRDYEIQTYLAQAIF